ncbi:MAG: hypothetical protein V7K67_12280 [Nostoc sp.]|uniref:hypothetical protein n=2 Tax=Nostoc sp. TaxID=1180 RepID=UPI002FFAB6A7
MLKRFRFFIFLCCVSTIFVLTIFSVNAQNKLTNKSKIFINGIGLVRVGMTVEQASKASGTQLIRDNYTDSGGNSNCFYVHPQSFSGNIEFMVKNGRISRVDILGNKLITTVKGARIGDTESRIKSLYPGQIKYNGEGSGVGYHLLIFIPKDRADSNYRIIFQIYKNRVNDFRAGKLPEVEYSEGCA